MSEKWLPSHLAWMVLALSSEFSWLGHNPFVQKSSSGAETRLVVTATQITNCISRLSQVILHLSAEATFTSITIVYAPAIRDQDGDPA